MAQKKVVPSEVANGAAKNLVKLYKKQQQDPVFRARFNTNPDTGMAMNPAIAYTPEMGKIHAGLDLADSLQKRETLSQALERAGKRK